MPYIDPNWRSRLDPHIAGLAEAIRREVIAVSPIPQGKHDWAVSAGMLNYSITRTILQMMPSSRPGYWVRALIHGVLGDVWDEFRRRIADMAEDEAAVRNGDIPEYAIISKVVLK